MTISIQDQIEYVRREITWQERHECWPYLPVLKAILSTLEKVAEGEKK